MFTLKVVTENADGTRSEDGQLLGPTYKINHGGPDGTMATVFSNRGDEFTIFDNECGFIINSFGQAITTIIGTETKRGKEKALEAQP